MSDWRKTYWQLFNILGRIIGVCFAIGGGIMGICGIRLFLDPKATVGVNGMPNNDPWIKAIVPIAGLVFCVLGIFQAFARPVRPDLDDDDSQNRKGGDKNPN